jgi:hypothetical protein
VSIYFYRVTKENFGNRKLENVAEVKMNNADFPFVPFRSVWCAIIYDHQRRKRDYLDGFDTLERAQTWLLLTLRQGERGELMPGHSLRATGEARYYKEGGRLLEVHDSDPAAEATRHAWWGRIYGDFV